MEQPWYRQYFWLLVFGGIILITAIISFLMVCFCKTQFSRSLTIRFQRTAKQEKNQTRDQNVAVITDNGFYQSRALPAIILPEVPDHHYDTIVEGVITSQEMYATAKKEPVTFQQQGTFSEYNGRKYDVDFHVHKDDRYSYASYDSVGHITDIDYINTENCTKDRDYIEVLADDDAYDDVEII